MKKLKFILLLMALSLFNNVANGISPGKFEYFFLEAEHRPFFSRKENKLQSLVNMPVEIRIRPKNIEQGIVFKIINWDCKLKIRLNKNLNFIISYN